MKSEPMTNPVEALIDTVLALHASDPSTPLRVLLREFADALASLSADTSGPANAEAVAKNVRAIRQDAERPAVRTTSSLRGAAEKPLPPSLSASIDLWRENAEAWRAEWRREHEFKVGLLKRVEELESAGRGAAEPEQPPQERAIRAAVAVIESLPADYDWNADPFYMTLIEGAVFKLNQGRVEAAPVPAPPAKT